MTARKTAGRREWIALAVLALPCIVYAMDLTVLDLALPALSADLRPSAAEQLWIVDVYGFMIAGLLITMGSLGDRIGRRRLLLLGAAGFIAASVLAALSTSAGMLIAARALLGVAGRDAGAVDALADHDAVPGSAAADVRGRGVGDELLRRRGDRPAGRRRAAAALRLELGVPARGCR